MAIICYSCTATKPRDCGADFPWNLDVADMFKVFFVTFHLSQIFRSKCKVKFVLENVSFKYIYTSKILQEWHHHKDEDILTYRDKSFASKFTGRSYFARVWTLKWQVMVIVAFQAPSLRSTTPTSCTPSTTPSTLSCTRQRSESEEKMV